MKTRIIVLLGAALVLVGVAPSWSQTTPSPAASPAAATSTDSRDGYLQSVKLSMASWRAKDAETDISGAWARVELAAERLDSVGVAGWADAKAAYERAVDDMNAAWAKFKPAKT